MARFSREELQQGLAHYESVVDTCSETGDWRPFADLFTEDVTYIEHAYGVMNDRESVRQWIVDVMAPFPHMRFSHEWVAFDEDAGAIVLQINNLLDHPTEEGVSFGFPNWTRLVYAGDNLFSSEEDVYNPRRDAPTAVRQWLAAGGRLATTDFAPMQHD
jgi:hypothetical protein